MFSLNELKQKKQDIEERNDLPIQDFIGWDGWDRMINSHIEALQKIEWLENRKEEVLVESGKRWTKLIKIQEILEED